MRMHDLAEKPFGLSKPKKAPSKPEPYYPSVSVDGVDSLGKLPLGKRMRLTVEGSVDSHEVRQTTDGNKTTTRIKLHAIGVPEGKGKARSHLCPKCGTAGSDGYCAECGEKRTARKRY